MPEARRPIIDFGPDDLVERLRDMYSDLQLNGKIPSDKNRDAVLERLAAELFLSSIGISSVPETWTTATPGGPLSSSFPFPSSPTLMPSSSQPGFGSSGKLSHSFKPDKEEDEQEKGDPVALRLRKYATLNTSAKFSTGEQPVLALSRWQLGEDPDNTEWIPGQDLEAEQAINRRRKKIEARRRKAERLSQRIFGESGAGFGSSFGGGRGSLPGGRGSFGPGMLLDSQQQEPSSQITMPTILSTSQPQQSQPPWEFSSQVPPMASPTRRVRVGSPLRREVRRESAGRRESGTAGGVFGPSRSQGLGLGMGMGMGSSQSQLQSQGQGQGMSQETPSQARSQVMPGLFGGRVSLSPFKKSPVKRVKRKSELRLSGFR